MGSFTFDLASGKSVVIVRARRPRAQAAAAANRRRAPRSRTRARGRARGGARQAPGRRAHREAAHRHHARRPVHLSVRPDVHADSRASATTASGCARRASCEEDVDWAKLPSSRTTRISRRTWTTRTSRTPGTCRPLARLRSGRDRGHLRQLQDTPAVGEVRLAGTLQEQVALKQPPRSARIGRGRRPAGKMPDCQPAARQ